MATNNYWLKSGLINIFQNLLSVGFAFLQFYILVRILSKSDYGIIGLFGSTTSIVELARNGLTQEALVKYYVGGDKKDKAQITTSVFIINLATTIILSVILIIVAPILSKGWDAPIMVEMFLVFTITFFISGILNIFICIEQASLRFSSIFYSTVLRQIVVFIYPLYCYIFKAEFDLIFFVYLQVFGVLVALLVLYFYARKNISFSKKIDLGWIKRILGFGVFTFGVTMSAMLAVSIDQMMLGWLLSTAAASVFNVAIRISNMTDIPTNAMSAIVYPQLSKRIIDSGHDSVKYLYEKSVGVILAILIPSISLLYLFSGPVLHIIAGEKYDDSLPLLRITLITCLFGPFGRQAGTVLNSAGKSKINFFLVLTGTCVIITTNYFMIRSFGVIGAAWATLITGITGTSLSQYFLKKYFNINGLNAFIYAFRFYSEFYNTYLKKLVKRS